MCAAADDEGSKLPLFFEKLTEDEQSDYFTLREKVGGPENRYNRNRRLAALQEQFKNIRSFCIRDDGRNAERCLVCGICWPDDGSLGINIRQFRMLINKSKSSINGALAKMQYVTVPTRDEDEKKLFQAVPYLRGHYLEQRQWTIRKKNGKVEKKNETNESKDKDEETVFIGQNEEEPMNDLCMLDWDDLDGVCPMFDPWRDDFTSVKFKYEDKLSKIKKFDLVLDEPMSASELILAEW